MSEFVIAAALTLIGGGGVAYLYSGVLHRAAGPATDRSRLPSQYHGFERRDFRQMDRRMRDLGQDSSGIERRSSGGRRITDANR